MQALLSFAVAVLLARALGPEGFGTYAFALSLVSLLVIVAQMGLPALVVREVARYQLTQDWARLRGLLQRANQAVFGLSGVLMLGIATLGYFLVDGDGGTALETFAYALLLLPLIALGNLRGAMLRGLHKVVQGQLPEMLVRPFLLFAFVGLCYVFGSLTPPIAMALYALAAALAFAVGVYLLLRVIPAQVRAARPRYDTAVWLRSALPLSLTSGMQVISRQAGIVILGILASSEEVGLYRVVTDVALMVSITLGVINVVIAPQIARLYHAGDLVRLQKMITWSARAILFTSLPVGIVLIVWGAPILQAVFGAEYVEGRVALAILCVGQIVNAVMGSVAFLLNMTGHERSVAKVVMLATSINITLNLILIPPFGIEGAASATAVSLVIWNVILHRQAKIRLGINSSALSTARDGVQP